MPFVDSRRMPGLYDKDEPQVMARFADLFDRQVHPGQRITVGSGDGEVPYDTALRLWLTGWTTYARDWRGEIIEDDDTKGVVSEGGAGGWYVVDAPWLDAPVKVQGKAAADAKFAELVAGAPDDWKARLADREQAMRDAETKALQEEADLVAAQAAADHAEATAQDAAEAEQQASEAQEQADKAAALAAADHAKDTTDAAASAAAGG